MRDADFGSAGAIASQSRVQPRAAIGHAAIHYAKCRDRVIRHMVLQGDLSPPPEAIDRGKPLIVFSIAGFLGRISRAADQAFLLGA